MALQYSAEFKQEEIVQVLAEINQNLKYIKQGKLPGLMKIWSTFVYADVMEHFQRKMGPGGFWEEWSTLYEERQNKLGRSSPDNILQGKKRRMQQSFTPSKYRQTSEGMLWYNPAKTQDGFPYAYAHDNDESARTTLPRRSFMWLSREAFENIAVATLDYLVATAFK